MFEEITEMIDYKVLGISLVLSLFFIIMVWAVPTWENYPFINKVMISIILPIIAYFIVLFQTG